MYVQIIRVEGRGAIRLGGIQLFDAKGDSLPIPSTAIATQSSDKVVFGTWGTRSFPNPAKNALSLTDSITNGTEDGWWEVNLGAMIEISKVYIISSNIDTLYLLNDSRGELLRDTSQIPRSMSSPASWTVNLPIPYSLGPLRTSGCIDNMQYTYQTCRNGSVGNACPSLYDNRLGSWYGPINTNSPEKLGVVNAQVCQTVGSYNLTDPGGWTACNGQAKTRTWKACNGTNCPPLPFTEVVPCSDGYLSPWSTWSQCLNGSSTRSRKCIPPVNDGKECPTGALEETQACKDGILTDWTEGPCIDNKMTKTRRCVPPLNNGTQCPSGMLSMVETCVSTTTPTIQNTKPLIQTSTEEEPVMIEDETETADNESNYRPNIYLVIILLVMLIISCSSGFGLALIT